MAEHTLIVMSDSHGDREIVAEIKERYRGKVSAIFHNGDSELPATDSLWQDIRVVQGNCDWTEAYPETLVTQLDGVRIAQTHGHLQHINVMWDRLHFFAQEAQADICLYGHLHRAAAWREGDIVFVNPGSVTQPRGAVQEKLYAAILVTDKQITVDFYTRNHELYPALSQEFIR